MEEGDEDKDIQYDENFSSESQDDVNNDIDNSNKNINENEDLTDVNKEQKSKKKIPRALIKKIVKFILFFSLFSFLFYKMFFSDDIEDIKNIEKIESSNRDDVNFKNRKIGSVAKKEDPIEELDVEKVMLNRKNPPVLEDPDLPNIEKINYFEEEDKSKAVTPQEKEDDKLRKMEEIFDKGSSQDLNNLNDDKSIDSLINKEKEDSKKEKQEDSIDDLERISNIDDIEKIANIQKSTSSPVKNQNSVNRGSPLVDYDDLSIDQKRKMSMFTIKGISAPVDKNSAKNKSGVKDFIVFDKDGEITGDDKNSSAPTRIRRLSNTIGKGKIIKGVIENAINSSISGSIRVISSYNVYGESGRNILIPRGSRLYCQYSTAIKIGQSRLSINCNQLLRPDGLKVTLKAYVADQFGRAGIEGDVDSRFIDAVKNSMMTSLLAIGTSVALQKIVGTDGQSQVVNNNGSVATTNITPVNAAAQSLIQTVSNLSNDMLAAGKNLSPVISTPQGMLVNIIIDQDIELSDY